MLSLFYILAYSVYHLIVKNLLEGLGIYSSYLLNFQSQYETPSEDGVHSIVLAGNVGGNFTFQGSMDMVIKGKCRLYNNGNVQVIR